MANSPLKALIVDAGNTRVRVAGWCGGDQDPRQRPDVNAGVALAPLVDLGALPTPTRDTEQSFATGMAEICAKSPDLPLVLASVVPLVVEILQKQRLQMTVISADRPLPFRLDLPNPETIGVDRLCNVAAAAAMGWSDALVIDAGTATTFDLLLDGEFIGGLIAPGMAFAADCLGRSAARLKQVAFAPCPLAPGRDTASAMQAGAFHVGVGGVEAVLSGLRQQYGPLPTVLTGGLGHLLDQPERLYDPDWTLRGAALLAGLPHSS